MFPTQHKQATPSQVRDITRLELTPLGKDLLKTIKASTVPSEAEFETSRYHVSHPSTAIDRAEASLVNYYMREDFRARTARVLTHESALVPTTHQGGRSTYHSLINYNELLECQCISPFKRPSSINDDARAAFEAKMTALALAAKQAKAQGESIHIAVIGSGALLQEAYLIAQLQKAGVTNIKLDLIDIDNEDNVQYVYANASRMRSEKTRQFCRILDDGLGLKVIPGTISRQDKCTAMNLMVRHFAHDTAEQYHRPGHELTIRFFGSTQDYAQQLARSKEARPELIYDIDLESRAEDHRSIVAPVRNIASDCMWVTVKKDPSLIGRYCDASMTVNRKKAGQWSQSELVPFFDRTQPAGFRFR